MLGAYFDTLAASLTLVSVYNGNSVHYMNSVKRTGLHTGAEAQTSVIT